MGHDLTKFPSQGLKFSWEPDQPIFVRGFLVSALTTRPTKVAKTNNSVGQTSLTRRRLRCPSESVTIRQARRNFRQTVDRRGGLRKLLFSSIMASLVTVMCPSFAVRGLNALFIKIQNVFSVSPGAHAITTYSVHPCACLCKNEYTPIETALL